MRGGGVSKEKKCSPKEDGEGSMGVVTMWTTFDGGEGAKERLARRNHQMNQEGEQQLGLNRPKRERDQGNKCNFERKPRTD